ncbi:MAG: valine--pyruvate transaminase [Spirochaetota bacterium]
MWSLSKFGQKFTQPSGIVSLMEDLGQALANNGEGVVMMGGGNPAHIPQVENLFQQELHKICNDPAKLRDFIGIYDPPQGKPTFLKSIAQLFQEHYAWDIAAKNICLTSGSQNAFFLLFNAFAGDFANGAKKHILLPILPEYIGYADIGIAENLFRSQKPLVECNENTHRFKYSIDFANLQITPETAAICVSRPTNPSANVLEDSEVSQLQEIAAKNNIPLILDAAYGAPFPNLLHKSISTRYDRNTIYCFSLSKLGLPALRTGIIIAEEEIIRSLTAMNAIISLSPNSAGSVLTEELFLSGELLQTCRNIVLPYYQNKLDLAVKCIEKHFTGFDYYLHNPEGAMFLWLWFPGLQITSQELYKRLKEKGVIVVSGHYFFPGLEEQTWPHAQQCLRVSYAQAEKDGLDRGFATIAEEVKKACLSSP